MSVWWAAGVTGIGIVALAVFRFVFRTSGRNELPPVSEQWLADYKRGHSR